MSKHVCTVHTYRNSSSLPPVTGVVHCIAHCFACLQDDASPEIVAHASGDEVDTSLIIPGGRRARKGRPQIGQQAQKYKYQQKLADSDEDSW